MVLVSKSEHLREFLFIFKFFSHRKNLEDYVSHTSFIAFHNTRENRNSAGDVSGQGSILEYLDDSPKHSQEINHTHTLKKIYSNFFYIHAFVFLNKI